VLLVLAVVAVTVGLGRPAPIAAGVAAWLPADGHRVRFASPASPGVAFAEWSTPDVFTLIQAAILGFPDWLGSTSLDASSTAYARLHTVLAGPDGTRTEVSDRLWTLGTDGARAAIEEDTTSARSNVTVLVPGRLDLPSDLAIGDHWTSEGTARTWDWDKTGGAFVETPYRADFRAFDAGQGCVEIVMDQRMRDTSRTERRTWCPGAGIAEFADAVGTWSPTDAGPPVHVDADQPFAWGDADSLKFTPRAVNQLGVPGNIQLNPVSVPGLLDGGAVVAGRLQPDVLGLVTRDAKAQVVWSARPGGMLAAAATLGGVTFVTTTAKQVVAYNNEGRWLWEARLGDLSVVAPVRIGDWVVVAALDGSVTAFDMATGAPEWRADLGAEIRSPLVVADDRLLVANQDGALVCLDAEGAQVWAVDAGVPSSMAVSPGADPVVVYGADGSMTLVAYSLADGRAVWRHRVYQNPHDLIALDSVVVVRDDDMTLGVDWTTGAVRWQWAAERTVVGLGGGQRALLLADADLVLIDADGRAVRTWPHNLGHVTRSTAFLAAAGKTVLAYGPSGMQIGALP